MSHNLFQPGAREQLKWLNEPQYWTFTAEDELIIDAPPKADFFKDPGGTHVAHSAPFLHTDVASTFQLTTQLQVDMRHLYDSGCLMMMADENNWAKLCFEFNGEFATIVSVVTQNGSSDDCNSERVLVDHPYLRMTKTEKIVSFHYSPDGEAWKLIRYFGMESSARFKAGIVAQSPMGAGCRVQFTSLLLSLPEEESRF
ncbi:DUF1349 domain-containing protein [Paenibacillus sp. P96]|uniref:DUF1349 domain-containing protein n=1 Tax=Paenibacillus zeirhizosphaerae TaxID=2987519 RepID=A0ABT9FKM2_9BACL|nr:DUF1349 domain-containing protein [Paenibacillus sp. P96]MDP4095275.1 DUF1349 domain-containing protein [Paenibacillus sp. P96]